MNLQRREPFPIEMLKEIVCKTLVIKPYKNAILIILPITPKITIQ